MENNRKIEKERSQEEYLKLRRSIMQNHYRTEKYKDPIALNQSSFFLKNKWISWLYHYIRSRFGKKYPFMSYDNVNDKGIYRLIKSNVDEDKEIKIALAGDWATDTRESVDISKLIKKYSPDYSIHLGDTYFVGMKDEIENNFLSDNSDWHKGTSGSFVLLGNHEMYSRGISYFRDLLPSMGVYSDEQKTYTGQKASYFCLENDYWRIIGLDTGYNSIGTPGLEMLSTYIPIKIFQDLFGPKYNFEDQIMDWLKNNININDDKRGIVLLTHHQYYSAFDDEYLKPAEQLAAIMGKERKVLWFWGHEHRFAVYGKYRSDSGITAYGRCIGHGGMPIEFTEKLNQDKAKKNNLILYDERKNDEIKDIAIGYNGFVILNILNDELSAEYRDIKDNLILKEVWTSDISSGEIKGKVFQVMNKDITIFSDDINKAIF